MPNDPIYFVSDVHLSPDAPERTNLFIGFLQRVRLSGGTLYILGDLFDFWVGPKHADLPDHQIALRRIKELTEGGVAVKFIYGNRDFYFDARVAGRFGIDVLGDEAVLRLPDTQLLLTHGDQFCTRDHGYRICRRAFASRPLRAFFKRLPVRWAYALAHLYRKISKWLHPRRRPARRAFSEDALQKVFAAGARVIVCGHGHEESTREIAVAGDRHLLYMLGDWTTRGSYLELKDGRFAFHTVEPDDHHCHAQCGH